MCICKLTYINLFKNQFYILLFRICIKAALDLKFKI